MYPNQSGQSYPDPNMGANIGANINPSNMYPSNMMSVPPQTMPIPQQNQNMNPMYPPNMNMNQGFYPSVNSNAGIPSNPGQVVWPTNQDPYGQVNYETMPPNNIYNMAMPQMMQPQPQQQQAIPHSTKHNEPNPEMILNKIDNVGTKWWYAIAILAAAAGILALVNLLTSLGVIANIVLIILAAVLIGLFFFMKGRYNKIATSISQAKSALQHQQHQQHQSQPPPQMQSSMPQQPQQQVLSPQPMPY